MADQIETDKIYGMMIADKYCAIKYLSKNPNSHFFLSKNGNWLHCPQYGGDECTYFDTMGSLSRVLKKEGITELVFKL